MTSIADIRTKAEYLAAWEPVEPGSEKHLKLIDWYRNAEATDPIYKGMTALIVKDTSATQIGEMYGQALAQDVPFLADVAAPAWSTQSDDLRSRDGNPERSWWNTFMDEKFFSATIERTDTYDVDAGAIIEGQINLMVGIDRNDQIEFISPEHAREAARKLLAAADVLEGVMKQEVE